MTAARYSVSIDNHQVLKQFAGAKFALTTLDPPAAYASTCRLVGPIEVMDGLTIPQFIQKAFNDEFKFSNVYDNQRGVQLTGRLETIAFSSAASELVNGWWDLAMTLHAPNGRSMRVQSRYHFKSGFDAMTACNHTAQALGPAVQDLIFTTVTDPAFRSLVLSSCAPGGCPETLPAPPASLVPTWERGYEWGFRWSSPSGSSNLVWTVVREEVTSDGAYYVVREGNREVYYTKNDLAWFMERVDGAVDFRATPPEQRFAWPLVMGKRWETKVRVERPLRRTSEERQRVFVVEAWEAVTVPAGTFGAFRIVARDPTGKITSETWFAPEVRQSIKRKTYFADGVMDRVLLEYKLGASVAPAP